MPIKTLEIDIKGYYREKALYNIPSKSGIYFVYSCISKNKDDKVVLDIKRLLYVGESKDIYDRLSNHEKKDDWKKELNSGEQLCYSYCLVPNADNRERIEAALIYQHQPLVNKELKDYFNYGDITISIAGALGLLDKLFTVKEN